MNIKILKDEYLFSNEGLHICDENGIAIKATEDTDCDVADEHFERVKELVISGRILKGLDENGDPVPLPSEG